MREGPARRPGVVRRGLVAALLALWLLAVHGLPAMGSFNSSPSPPSMTVSSATLAAPTGFTASCLVSFSIRLDWTVSSSSWADGQEIWQSTNGGSTYSLLATVSASTATYTTSTLGIGTYYWKVRATKNNWRSAFSNADGVQITLFVCTNL